MTINKLPAPIRRLREIAAKVKQWEDRDHRETESSMRNLYFVDLEEIAQMFEGTHARFLAMVRPKGGWQRTAWNTVRDFEIAEFMHQQRARPDYNHEEAVESALARFPSIGSAKSIERADTRFRHVIEGSTDREATLMAEVLVASRMAKRVQAKP